MADEYKQYRRVVWKTCGMCIDEALGKWYVAMLSILDNIERYGIEVSVNGYFKLGFAYLLYLFRELMLDMIY